MSAEPPAANVAEEPQDVRGEPGSRDTGAEGPGGGPVDRPAGGSDEDSDSSVDAQGATHEDMPELPTGD